MKKLSEIPFINVSKENLMAAADMLDREQKGELLEMIIDAVLNDSSPTSNSKCVSGVFNQFMAVINRKAEKCVNRAKGIEEYNRKRSEAKNGNNQVIPQEEVDEHNAVPEAKIKNTELPEVVEVEQPKIITEQTEKRSNRPSLKECVDELMDIYHTKNYESMIYAINHKCRNWGYTFEELKAKCDTRIELG